MQVRFKKTVALGEPIKAKRLIRGQFVQIESNKKQRFEAGRVYDFKGAGKPVLAHIETLLERGLVEAYQGPEAPEITKVASSGGQSGKGGKAKPPAKSPGGGSDSKEATEPSDGDAPNDDDGAPDDGEGSGPNTGQDAGQGTSQVPGPLGRD